MKNTIISSFISLISTSVLATVPVLPTEIQILSNPSGSDDAHFGATMAKGDFNDDGQMDLAVSAPNDGIGAVYVFFGPEFNQSKSIKIEAPSNTSSFFGGALIFVPSKQENQPDQLVISAPNFRQETSEHSGAVYFYKNRATLPHKTITTTPSKDKFFGSALALDSNNNLFIGARGEVNPKTKISAGAVYMYDTDDLDKQPLIIHNPSQSSQDANGNFGKFIEVENDKLVISALGNKDTNSDHKNAGQVYWANLPLDSNNPQSSLKVLEDPILSEEQGMGSRFGMHAGVTSHGIAVGAPRHDRDNESGQSVEDNGAAVYYPYNKRDQSYGQPIVLSQQDAGISFSENALCGYRTYFSNVTGNKAEDLLMYCLGLKKLFVYNGSDFNKVSQVALPADFERPQSSVTFGNGSMALGDSYFNQLAGRVLLIRFLKDSNSNSRANSRP